MQLSKSENKKILLGDNFEKYKIEKILGKGGMGEVYLVRHNILDSLFAMKVLSPEIATKNKQYVDRFIREAKLACKIKHPNLVAVYDAGKNSYNGMYYIVMEYVNGGNVREALKKIKHFSVPQALTVIRQIASALEEAQKYNMVHRDIKPDNIMFTQEGIAKLADLGIAKSTNEQDTMLTIEASVFGTPAYMSPEQAIDSRNVDSRSDIYSLGIVFFEMLAGQRPYKGESMIEILSQVVKDEEIANIKTILPNLDENVANLVMAMVTKDITKRIQSPSKLLQEIDKIKLSNSESLLSNNLTEQLHKEQLDLTLPTMVKNTTPPIEVTLPTVVKYKKAPTIDMFPSAKTNTINNVEENNISNDIEENNISLSTKKESINDDIPVFSIKRTASSKKEISQNTTFKKKYIIYFMSLFIIILFFLLILYNIKRETPKSQNSLPVEELSYIQKESSTPKNIKSPVKMNNLSTIEIEKFPHNSIIYISSEKTIPNELKISINDMDNKSVLNFNLLNYGLYRRDLKRIINIHPRLIILNLSQHYANLDISNSSFENLIRDITIQFCDNHIPFIFIIDKNENKTFKTRSFDNAIKELSKLRSYSIIDLNTLSDNKIKQIFSETLSQ